MHKGPLRIGAVALLCAGLLGADFSYQESSKITGGFLAGAMKVMGAFSKQAREPILTTVMVKGNRMATVSRESAQILDLDRETLTEVNYQKKTYSVVTFAEMGQAMEQLARKMTDETAARKLDLSVSASVKQTGRSRVLSGMNTTEAILSFEMEGTDPQSGQQAALVMTADIWLAPGVPGYEEVQDFNRRMVEKISWAPATAGMFAQSEMMKGMGEIAKQVSKLNGVPLLQLTKMGIKGEPPPSPRTQGSTEAQPQMPSSGEVAGTAAAGAVQNRLGRLGGLAGGLGGLGRRKKQQEEPPPPPPPPPSPPQQQQPASGFDLAPGSLMEMTTEMTGFSSTVDTSKLEVPAGFKQVESEVTKVMRKR